MESKERCCSKCFKKCDINLPKGVGNPISNILCILISFPFSNEKGYSTCCNAEVIYLTMKERILKAL